MANGDKYMKIFVPLIILLFSVHNVSGQLTNYYLLLVDYEHNESRNTTNDDVMLGSRFSWGDKSFHILPINSTERVTKSIISENAISISQTGSIMLENRSYKVLKLSDNFVELRDNETGITNYVSNAKDFYDIKILEDGSLTFQKQKDAEHAPPAGRGEAPRP